MVLHKGFMRSQLLLVVVESLFAVTQCTGRLPASLPLPPVCILISYPKPSKIGNFQLHVFACWTSKGGVKTFFSTSVQWAVPPEPHPVCRPLPGVVSRLLGIDNEELQSDRAETTESKDKSCHKVALKRVCSCLV